MRLFIASPILLDDYASIKEDFKNIIEGKWVEEENLHLTWVFLGDVGDEKSIIDKLKEISPLESKISIEKLGYFGRPPRVFFAKAEEKELYDKAKEFRNSGFKLYRFIGFTGQPTIDILGDGNHKKHHRDKSAYEQI